MNSENLINQVIQEAPKQDSVGDAPDAPVSQGPVVEEQSQQVDQKNPQSTDVPFPKKAVNAISRRDRQIGKMRAEIAAMRAEVERFQSQANQGRKSDGVPREEDFDHYGDYLKATTMHEFRKEQAEREQVQQQQQISQQEQRWIAERSAALDAKEQEYVASIPDYAEVMSENADIVQEFPAHVKRAFLEADDASLAFYNLAKSGKLESLASMSPYRAAMEIARAQDIKPTAVKQTQAPKPLQGAKGTGKGSPSLDDMSWAEMKKFLKS